MKRPAYQWYPGDADLDEVYKLMTYEQEGVYRRLLDHQWIEGSIPADPNVIAGLLPKVPREQFLKIWPLISCKFRPRGSDRLVNDKLEKQRREREKFLRSQTRKSAKGVAVRKLRTQKPQPTGQPVDKPDTGPGLTSSSSSSTTTTTVKLTPPLPPPLPGQATPLIPRGAHRNHAFCGKVCLPAALLEQFTARMTHLTEPEGYAYVSRFFDEWNARYATGDRAEIVIGEDAFDFWRERWKETHPPAEKNMRRSGKFLSDVDGAITIVQPGKAAAS